MVHGSYFSTLFSEYREINNEMIHICERAQSELDAIDAIISTKSIDKKDVLTAKAKLDDKKYDESFSALKKEIPYLKPALGELMALLKKENDSLSSHLKGLSIDAVVSAETMFKMLVSHNQEKYELIKKLQTGAPHLFKDLQRVIGINEVSLDSSVQGFMHYFEKLVNEIENGGNKGNLFFMLANTLEYLRAYLSESSRFHTGSEQNVLHSIQNSGVNGEIQKLAKEFVKHFFTNYNDILKRLDEIMEANDFSLDPKKGKSYSGLEDKPKGKVDKYTQATLIDLLTSKKRDIERIFGEKKDKEGGDDETVPDK